MPQPERSKVNKELLVWLLAKTKSSNGASRMEVLRHVALEITELGATERTTINYLKTLDGLGLVKVDSLGKYTVTKVGENWLKRKVS